MSCIESCRKKSSNNHNSNNNEISKNLSQSEKNCSATDTTLMRPYRADSSFKLPFNLRNDNSLNLSLLLFKVSPSV